LLRFGKGALLRVRSFGALGVRRCALLAVAAAVGFSQVVLGPTACDPAARPAACATREKSMKNPGSFRSLPRELWVRLRVIPEKQQRYDTVGDWLWSDSTLEIRISREAADDDPRYATLLFVHELIEALLCRSAGISAAQVDSFDMSHLDADEPGADPAAPYHREHLAAEAAERALAAQLDVNWDRYVSR
jgi:hypothetical protein